VNAIAALRRFARARSAAGCELCGAALAEQHEHVVDPRRREMKCACLACAVLFPGEGDGRFRRVRRHAEPVRIDDGQWELLDLPVGLAFFVRGGGKVTAFYPSPAGATESGLALETWDEMVQSLPVLATLEPDVEALLVCRRPTRAECWIMPVDACYALVGRIRRHWKGFEGGAEAWREIDEFFGGLPERETEAAYG
jgi:uncharacterized protein DUF5947